MSGEHHVARRSWRGPLGLVVGLMLTLGAWWALVLTAIDFGRAGRAGGVLPWVLLAVSSAGAILSLFLAILLATRLIHALRSRKLAPPRPSGPRAKGGKRAARTGTDKPAEPAVPAAPVPPAAASRRPPPPPQTQRGGTDA